MKLSHLKEELRCRNSKGKLIQTLIPLLKEKKLILIETDNKNYKFKYKTNNKWLMKYKN